MTVPNFLRQMRRLSLPAFLALLAAPATQAGFTLNASPDVPSCGAHVAGSPCDSGGVASQSSGTGVTTGVGNPINIVNGNKYQKEVDLPPLPGELGLEIVRHYNSSAAMVVGQVGAGWRLSYETDLYVVGNSIQILQADGSRRIFARDAQQPGLCTPPDPAHGRVITRRTARGEEYTWEWSDGRKLLFNGQGKLEQIVAPSGAFVTLTRGPKGELLKVTDPQGRQLRLRYLEPALAKKHDRFAGVVAIDSPVGQFRYEHGSVVPDTVKADQQADPTQAPRLANLVKVSYPSHYDPARKPYPTADYGITVSAVSRIYHYDDPSPGHHAYLTGISVSGAGSDGKLVNERIATWGYRADGRAILSTHAGDVDKVTLDFIQPSLPGGKPGKTVLTDSLGRKTEYLHQVIAGEYRLLEVTGPGCASCGETNVRYGYDKRGHLIETSRLDAAGKAVATVRSERDRLGRVVKVSRIDYRNGKPQQPQLQSRYEYEGDRLQPALIARPSVVAGKEHQVQISYNDKEQMVRMTESGYSPIGDKGQLMNVAFAAQAGHAALLTRTTTYKYQVINGRSVLVEIDGPLKNGPKNTPEDSDITRAEWDKSGNHVVEWIGPGNVRSKVDYDPATGRLAQVTNAEGFSTRFTYNAFGQPAYISSTGPGWVRPQVRSFKYDAMGNPTESGWGSETDNSYQPQEKQAFDPAGRLLWKASALGVLEQRRYDTENNLLESGRYSSNMALVQRYAYDLYGRLAQTTNNRGMRVGITYDDQGRPESLTDSLGRLHRIERAHAVTTAAEKVRPHQLVDDFGRIVATLSPDSGATTRRFDEANRLIGNIDAQGNSAVYVHDAAGRILRQQIADKRTGKTDVTVWRYQGEHLVAIDHSTQSDQYQYDERGLLVVKTTKQKRSDGGAIISTTRYAYDEDGVLQSMTLPDGSRIEYERNGQGQVVAVKRSQIQTSWLRWLLPSRILVKNIERDVVGLKRYITANGIEVRYQRSREGVLARVAYRRTQISSNATSLHASGNALDLLGIASAHANETTGTPGTSPVSAASQPQLPGALGLPADANALIDHRYLWDAQGNLLHLQDRAGREGAANYAYDREDRLIAAVRTQEKAHETNRYFYDQQGRRALSQESVHDQGDLTSQTRKALYQQDTHRWLGEEQANASYDANGQPERIKDRKYVWDALGRLLEVRQQDRLLARYTYSYRGERIRKQTPGNVTHYLYEGNKLSAELDAQGKLTRQYVYLADQPIAVIDSIRGDVPDSQERGAVKRIMHDLGVAVEAWFANGERIVWLHTDHLGAIEAATGQDGRLLWRASYRPFGQADVSSSGFMLNLRLPGQYEDRETGLYYNARRYYDPETGRYLTPDPLGTPDGPNPYAYVKGNPLRYIDPSGLILFAFDGTGNDETDPNTLSNVVKFRDLYEDSNEKYYITGPGTRDPATGIENPPYKGGNPTDVAESFTGKERIAAMIDYLNQYSDTVDDATAFDIDVVGFSRGSAQARDFANQVVGNYQNGYYRYKDKQGDARCQKVNFRFMGLFDTVLSEHTGSYQLRIPDVFEYVAQAVALNEYRGNVVKFPLESIMGVPVSNDRTRIERGFLGSHSDIGGGFEQGDLSKVALVWMVDQAKAAGVKMSNPENIIIADPVLHDKSTNLLFGAPDGGPTVTSEDRDVRYMDGTIAKQRQANTFGMSWGDTTPFITYKADPNSIDNISGTVDMNAYLQWLNEHHYDIDMTVQ